MFTNREMPSPASTSALPPHTCEARADGDAHLSPPALPLRGASAKQPVHSPDPRCQKTTTPHALHTHTITHMMRGSMVAAAAGMSQHWLCQGSPIMRHRASL